MKSRGGKDVTVEIRLEDPSCVHFIMLKKFNQLAHVRMKKGRDQTHKAKQKLQNLLYEVTHLQEEIIKCLEFKSKHEETDHLVTLQQFYKEAPPVTSKAKVTMEPSLANTWMFGKGAEAAEKAGREVL